MNELFKTPLLSQGLNRLTTAPALYLTPDQIYSEIKTVAKARYDFELPAKQKKLYWLGSVNNKASVLRDLC